VTPTFNISGRAGLRNVNCGRRAIAGLNQSGNGIVPSMNQHAEVIPVIR
jgi:hypothetical protein